MNQIVSLADSLKPLISELRQQPRMTGVSLNRLCKRFVRVTCVACFSTLAHPRNTHRKSG